MESPCEARMPRLSSKSGILNPAGVLPPGAAKRPTQLTPVSAGRTSRQGPRPSGERHILEQFPGLHSWWVIPHTDLSFLFCDHLLLNNRTRDAEAQAGRHAHRAAARSRNAPTNVVNLMDALRRSVEAEKSAAARGKAADEKTAKEPERRTGKGARKAG